MKSYPSEKVLSDSTNRNAIDRILSDINMNLAGYMAILIDSLVKDKHIVTTAGKEVLMFPQHQALHERLKVRYPERQWNSM